MCAHPVFFYENVITLRSINGMQIVVRCTQCVSSLSRNYSDAEQSGVSLDTKRYFSPRQMHYCKFYYFSEKDQK